MTRQTSKSIIVATVLFSQWASRGAMADDAVAGAQERVVSPKKVGILVFPGVQVIDFTGPYEVLVSGQSTRARKPLFDVVLVGLTGETFRAGSMDRGIQIRPDFSLDKSPKLDILVIPGGEVGQIEDNARAMKWVGKAVGEAECVMSVCNGAFILAKGGHLKNQRATTFFYFIDELKKVEPTCTPVHDERFVDNGKIITTAGLSSGIDGALHLVARYGSQYDAEQCALGLEYHWQPELNWSRGGLADRHYIRMVGRGFDFPDNALKGWTTVENSGTVDRWTKRWTFKSTLDHAAIAKGFESKMASAWKKVSDDTKGSTWSFKDDNSNRWSASLAINSTGQQEWEAVLRIVKDGPKG